MRKTNDYNQYEAEKAMRHLKKLTGSQTFKMGLELSDLALKMLFSSLLQHARSNKTATNKLRLLLRSM